MKRPIGLILSAVALSLAAFFFALSTVMMVMVGIFADKHHPFIASMPTTTPHFFLYLMLAAAVFYALLAAWATLTVIGILRLRSWARYSILIIGGGLAVIGLFGAMGTLVSHTTLPNLSAQQPNADPRILSAVFFALTVFYLLVSAIGVWWLIYFNLRTIRELFSGARIQTPSSTGILASQDLVPTPIKIVAIFLFIGAAGCLLCLFLPFPAFFFGFILPPTATHVLYLAFAALAAFAGYGLLHLRESGRLLTMAFVIVSFCNLIVIALPWNQSRFQTYTTQIIHSMPTFPGQPQPPITSSSMPLLFSAFIGLILYGFVLWLLHRHRAAFKSAIPPPPMLET